MKLPKHNFEYPRRVKRIKRTWTLLLVVWFVSMLGLWFLPPEIDQLADVFDFPRSIGTLEYVKYSSWPSALGPKPSGAMFQPELKLQWLELIVTIALTIAPTGIVIYLMRWATLPRYSARFCDECGYDLKATHNSTCPECGTEKSKQNVSTH
jgi:hypothetical protein